MAFSAKRESCTGYMHIGLRGGPAYIDVHRPEGRAWHTPAYSKTTANGYCHTLLSYSYKPDLPWPSTGPSSQKWRSVINMQPPSHPPAACHARAPTCSVSGMHSICALLYAMLHAHSVQRQGNAPLLITPPARRPRKQTRGRAGLGEVSAARHSQHGRVAWTGVSWSQGCQAGTVIGEQ